MKPLDIEIFVPSRSRFDKSLTLEALAFGNVAHITTLVVPYDQARDYVPLARRHGIKQVLRCKQNGIAKTREFIGQRAQGKFIMLDDDLRFTYRKSVKDWQLYMFEEEHMERMLRYVSKLLDTYAHVSVSPRQMNQKYATFCSEKIKPEPEKYPFYVCGRPIRALAYRKDEFLRCEHGRVAIMEDFDVTLQLLRMGYQNAIITSYAQDQVQTQMPGGCSDYRTHALHARNVRTMAKLHEGYVSLKEKANKTGGEFGKRVEAMIQWQKAWKTAVEALL